LLLFPNIFAEKLVISRHLNTFLLFPIPLFDLFVLFVLNILDRYFAPLPLYLYLLLPQKALKALSPIFQRRRQFLSYHVFKLPFFEVTRIFCASSTDTAKVTIFKC